VTDYGKMKILFCSDGSSQAEEAVRFGAQIAAACQAEPSILGISEQARDQDPLLQALRRAQDILKEHQLDAELVTKAGRPVREIVKRTTEVRYDLVVIGAACKHPLSRLFDTSSMSARAYKIIESVEPPVLVVFCDRPALRRILLCTSGSAYTDRAVEFAGKIARCVDATVNLFHVMPEPPAMFNGLLRREEEYADHVLESKSRLGQALRRQKDLLEQFGVFGALRLTHGDVAQGLLRELRRTEYDLVVSGSAPAEDKLHRYVMGDLTREIVNRAGIPVLVVRTGQRPVGHRFQELLGSLFRRSKKTSEASKS
jgi:nucleotide-binding universal stress UspA family protein